MARSRAIRPSVLLALLLTFGQGCGFRNTRRDAAKESRDGSARTAASPTSPTGYEEAQKFAKEAEKRDAPDFSDPPAIAAGAVLVLLLLLIIVFAG